MVYLLIRKWYINTPGNIISSRGEWFRVLFECNTTRGYSAVLSKDCDKKCKCANFFVPISRVSKGINKFIRAEYYLGFGKYIVFVVSGFVSRSGSPQIMPFFILSSVFLTILKDIWKTELWKDHWATNPDEIA